MNRRHIAIVAASLLLVSAAGYAFYRLSGRLTPAMDSGNEQRVDLDLASLKNGDFAYRAGITYFSGEHQQFNEGTARAGDSQYILDADHAAFGDLDLDALNDAAVVMTIRVLGTVGADREANSLILNAVLNRNGKPYIAANAWLAFSDAATINAVSIQDEVISVNITDPKQGLARKTLRFRLSGDQLVRL